MSIANSIDPKYMDIGGAPIVSKNNVEDPDVKKDTDWVKIAFMVTDEEIGDPDDIANRYYSSASGKFVDTKLGGNIGINPRPQFTRYADIRDKGRFGKDRKDVTISNISGNYGLGRYYSENIDDPAQKIYLRFGVPRFNSLTTFLFRAFDREMTVMARTGRAPSAWYKAAQLAGKAVAFVAFPWLTISVEAGKAMHWLLSRGTSKFFTIKPTMHFYWSTVSQLVNNHAVNTGIIKKVLEDDTNRTRLGHVYKLDEENLNHIKEIFPDVFNSEGFIDIFAMANRAQRKANVLFEMDYAKLNGDSASETDFYGYLKKDNTGNGRHGSYISNDRGSPTLGAFLNKYISVGDYYKATLEGGDKEKAERSITPELDPRVDLSNPKATTELKEGGYIDNLRMAADAEWRDGAAFAVFRVDHTGSTSESFGNSVAESELANKLNGTASTFREARFSLAGGNILGDTVESITNAVGDVALGALDGVTLGFTGLIAGLGGGGYVDIPKHWQASSANLPRGSYTIQLISPYNNPVSRLINIWVPFYMLLAGVLPRSTGKQSYGAPYYCQLYDRGRVQTRTGMIESLSVTRGTSNLAFDTEGQALALDVNFSIVDLSTVMHMPMSSGGIFENDMTMDDDNITADYLNVLAGMDIYSQIYTVPRAQLKLTKKLAQFRSKANSPFFMASLFKNSVENGLINDLTLGLSGLASEAITAGVVGSSLVDGNTRR